MVLSKTQLSHIAAIEKELKALKLGSKSETQVSAKLTKKVENSIIECSTKKELGEFTLEHLSAFAKKNKIKTGKLTKDVLATAVLKWIKENYDSESESESESDSESDSD